VNAINLIRNCRVKFRKVCPQQWEDLAPTVAEDVRFCDACARDVFFCVTDDDAVAHARAGHCIAKPVSDLSSLPSVPLVVGQPEVPPRKLTPEQWLLKEEADRENAKTYSLRDVDYASRMCPRCSYPCAEWLRSCGVCGYGIGRAGTSEAR
jgi:hypothetical protein